MSLVAVAAGKGSRGVTTAALALAAVWPQQRRVLLAECDPAGGSLGVRFGLRPVPGLLTLASVGRRSLDPQELWSHVQPLPGGGLEALLAPVRAEQLLALGRLWADLPAAIARLDADVIADCGRILPGSPVETLVAQGVRPVVLPVGERPYSAAEIASLLEGDNPAEVVGVLADDPRAARMLAGEPGRPRYFDRSLLVRSAREVALRLAELLAPPRPAEASRASLPSPPPAPEDTAQAQQQPAPAERDPFATWMEEVQR